MWWFLKIPLLVTILVVRLAQLCSPAETYLLERLQIMHLAANEPPPPADFNDAVRVRSPFASEDGGNNASFVEVTLCTSTDPAACPDFAVLVPKTRDSSLAQRRRLPLISLVYPLFGMDAGTWARVKDSATLTHLASHGFAVAYSLHHATSGVRACANCHGIEAYLMHAAHPVMGLHAVLAAAYPDLSGQAFSANAKMKTPTTSTFRLPGRRKKAGRDVPPFPDSRVQTIPYDASGVAAADALRGRVDAHRMAISGFSVGGAVAASVARTCAVQGEATCGQVRFRSFAALAPTPGLPIEQGGVGTRESMSNLTGAPGLSGLIVAGENDRMGATTDGVDFLYERMTDSPRVSVLIRNASHCFVAAPPSIECGVNPVETTRDAFSLPPLPNPYFNKQIATARMLLAQFFTASLGDARDPNVAAAAADIWSEDGTMSRAAKATPWHPLSADVLALGRMRRDPEMTLQTSSSVISGGQQQCVDMTLSVPTEQLAVDEDGRQSEWRVGLADGGIQEDGEMEGGGTPRRGLLQYDRWVAGGGGGGGGGGGQQGQQGQQGQEQQQQQQQQERQSYFPVVTPDAPLRLTNADFVRNQASFRACAVAPSKAARRAKAARVTVAKVTSPTGPGSEESAAVVEALISKVIWL